jgi:hypothetical protein
MLWQLKTRCPKPLGTNTNSGLDRAPVYSARYSWSRPRPSDDMHVPPEAVPPVVYTAGTWRGYKFGMNHEFSHRHNVEEEIRRLAEILR